MGELLSGAGVVLSNVLPLQEWLKHDTANTDPEIASREGQTKGQELLHRLPKAFGSVKHSITWATMRSFGVGTRKVTDTDASNYR